VAGKVENFFGKKSFLNIIQVINGQHRDSSFDKIKNKLIFYEKI